MTTNEVELVTTNAVQVISHITPQNVAFTFKEWTGVIATIAASIYAGMHMIFMAVTHYGGLRKMWSDFLGPKLPGEEPVKEKEKTV